MSKVICDICGTAYPETSSQCPICGGAKRSADQTAAAETSTQRPAANTNSTSNYTYVKGGRFSKKNVRKRNSGKMPERRESGRQDNNEKTNAGLIAVVIILLLAIIGMVIYIGVRFLSAGGDQTKGSSSVQDTGGSNGSTGSTEKDVLCEDLTLSSQTIEFTAEGETYDLAVVLTPDNTTEPVIFTSSDKEVAMVSESGTIMSVGYGEAVITVTCGGITKECRIVCSFNAPKPTEPSQPEEFVFRFDTKFVDDYTGKQDITFVTKKKWTAYTSELTVDPSLITWTSDNPAVCTIENGIVTIVGSGTTDIHAQYQGKTFTCIVRVTLEEEEETSGSCTISHDDVSIAIGETFTLTLKDGNGNVLDVQWKAETASYVTIEGNKITGAATGTTKVSAEHEGVTYTCIVRVK